VFFERLSYSFHRESRIPLKFIKGFFENPVFVLSDTYIKCQNTFLLESIRDEKNSSDTATYRVIASHFCRSDLIQRHPCEKNFFSFPLSLKKTSEEIFFLMDDIL
jgi:hypothetical protein